MAKIKVTAGAGRTTPIDPRIATAPGAARLVLRGPRPDCPEGDVIEVEESDHAIFRQLRSGDLVRVKTPAATSSTQATFKVGDVELAQIKPIAGADTASPTPAASAPASPAKES